MSYYLHPLSLSGHYPLYAKKIRYVGKQGERGEAKLSTRQTRLETR